MKCSEAEPFRCGKNPVCSLSCRHLYEWSSSLPVNSLLKKAVNHVLCAACHIHPPYFQQLLHWAGFLGPDLSATATDDSKDNAQQQQVGRLCDRWQGCVTGGKAGCWAVTGGKAECWAVTGGKAEGWAVTGGKAEGWAVTGGKAECWAVTGGKAECWAVTGGKAECWAVTGGKAEGWAVTGGKAECWAVTGGKAECWAVTGGKAEGWAVTGGKAECWAVTGGKVECTWAVTLMSSGLVTGGKAKCWAVLCAAGWIAVIVRLAEVEPFLVSESKSISVLKMSKMNSLRDIRDVVHNSGK